jgi:hypothetical protein
MRFFVRVSVQLLAGKGTTVPYVHTWEGNEQNVNKNFE